MTEPARVVATLREPFGLQHRWLDAPQARGYSTVDTNRQLLTSASAFQNGAAKIYLLFSAFDDPGGIVVT